MIIVLSGKTASGKDTVKDLLIKKYPELKRIITTTSRIPRSGEQQDVDYYFITRDEFGKKIKSKEFVEYVEYGGNLYGTTKDELEKALDFDMLWKIDPSRAGEIRGFIKRSFPEDVAEKILKRILVIYLNTEDKVILERLKKRNLSDEEIRKRMEDDKRIWDKYKDNYDFVVENIPEKLNETISEIDKLIKQSATSDV